MAEKNQSSSFSSSASDASTRRRVAGSRPMKRKVLRQVNGESRIFDESSVSETSILDEFSSTSNHGDLLRNSGPYDRQPTYQRPEWRHPPYNDEEDDVESVTSERSSFSYPRSYLVPTEQDVIQGKAASKCDPVRQYHMYRQMWEAHKPPGVKRHDALRWAIREQMLCYDAPPRRPRISATVTSGLYKDKRLPRWDIPRVFEDDWL